MIDPLPYPHDAREREFRRQRERTLRHSIAALQHRQVVAFVGKSFWSIHDRRRERELRLMRYELADLVRQRTREAL